VIGRRDPLGSDDRMNHGNDRQPVPPRGLADNA
jgi:hypothetical protein